jgi:DNA-directed RNA polymerase beta subunit
MEEITRVIPEISDELTQHLNPSGIAKLGSWIQEGDILVVTPINKTNLITKTTLYYFRKPVLPVRDITCNSVLKLKSLGFKF